MSKVERVIPGGIREIPGLLLANVEPGQSEPVKYGERIIPETFMAVFGFEDISKARALKNRGIFILMCELQSTAHRYLNQLPFTGRNLQQFNAGN